MKLEELRQQVEKKREELLRQEERYRHAAQKVEEIEEKIRERGIDPERIYDEIERLNNALLTLHEELDTTIEELQGVLGQD